ncbi:unnamed protein product [Acanthoscelides obtectus]|uniref:Uncharacterized protein n=1 Tax=Acanthoscelides obtectus TaxID=200917 RepID=A0A9P0K049_ACAOB|nr:unnamed protein product [Acanthoscelides obtectus]CAK1625255.1 hypothetical protein AOBTE_LOCUS3062 [Acanthoscelides obtectus]
MSSDEEGATCEENAQVKFVELLENYKVVLQKSQVPTMKKVKEAALMKLEAEWQALSGKAIGAVQVVVPPPIETAVSVEVISSEFHSSVMVVETATGSLSKKKKKACLPETSETQNLSTAELQRLVLLEQLQVMRLKKRKLMRELAENESEKELVTEHDNVYPQL